MCSEWENMREFTLCVYAWMCLCDANYRRLHAVHLWVWVVRRCVSVCVWVPNVFESNEHFQSMHKHSTTIKQSSELLVRVDHPLASQSPSLSHKWKVEFREMNARTHLFIFVCLFVAYHASIAEQNLYSTTFQKSYEHNQWNPNILFHITECKIVYIKKEKLSRVELNNGTLTHKLKQKLCWVCFELGRHINIYVVGT